MRIQKLLYQSVVWRGFYFISAFALNIVMARVLEARGSGLLFFMVNLYTLVLMILGMGMEAAIGYFAAKKPSMQLKLLKFALLASLAIGIISALVFYILPELELLNHKINFPLSFAVCFIAGNFLLGSAGVLFYAKENFFIPNILSTAINILLVVFFLFDPGQDYVQTVYFASFAVLAVITILAFYTSYAKDQDKGLISKNEISALYRYGLHAYVGNLLFFLLYRIDYWFVERYCSGQELGNYIQVSKLAQMFFVLPGVLASAVLPLTAGGRREEVNNILTRICRALLLTYSFACLFLIATGKWLFPWLYGSSFSNMYYPFVLLVPGILALSTLFTLTAYNAGKNKLKVNIYGAVIALVIVLAGDRLLIPRYGINAAALVSSVAYIAYHIFVLTDFRREYKTPLADFFKVKISDLAGIASLVRPVKKDHEIKQ